MYSILSLTLSVALGSFLGLIYGLSLRFIQGRVPPFFHGIISFFRIVSIAFLFFYLLHLGVIHFILLLICFTGTFWSTILWFVL